jgi:hypothetical protein
MALLDGLQPVMALPVCLVQAGVTAINLVGKLAQYHNQLQSIKR